ncbi:TetR/AcrR family transcriptional regulator [Defluviimonas salinarum]|uniref:TetR/AcrR family transcriptional regulator n=1 Tax=Defluviimonas salinarum TaxID=2992147 RepID=A0ABT3J7D9_9RHOB|nr:TetR/AcrR family transcriptional regulator [Defluviimonas salinarum]MCW3783607.1 TetR/AcrR family transcriptional regulator [Defluviimonas salinarum]
MTEFRGFPTKDELREIKRREIVRCASEKFGREGFDSVSLNSIASELGVTKTALYHYVSSKSDLLMQCYQAGLESILEAIRKTAEGPGSAAEKLHKTIVEYIKIVTRNDMQYLWNYVPPVVKEADGTIVQERRDEVDTIIRQLLADGVKDGSMRADLDPRLASLVILGAANWVGIWFRPGGKMKPAEVAENIARETLQGFLA